MHGSSSPLPDLMLERCRLSVSVTLHVIVLFLAKKYQQTLHISLGTCPTVFLLLPLPLELRWCAFAVCLHTVTRTSAVQCYVICVRCGELERRVATSNPELHGCQQYWPGGCVGVQSPVAGCDNVNMGAISCSDVTNIRPPPCLSTK